MTANGKFKFNDKRYRMKMRILKFMALSAIATLGIMLASCAKEELDVSQLYGEPKYVSFSAALPKKAANTDKTILQTNGKVHWLSSDTVVVNGTTFYGVQVDATDKTKASFSGTVTPAPGNVYWGVYPESIASNTLQDYQNGTMKVTLPSHQYYRRATDFTDSLPSYMVAYKQESGSMVELQFRNLCCILKIPLTGKNGSNVPNKTVTRIDVSSTAVDLAGLANVSWNGGNPSMNFTTGYNMVSFFYNKELPHNNTYDTFCIMLPPIPAGTVLTVRIHTANNTVQTQTLTPSFALQRNNIYRLAGLTVDPREPDTWVSEEYTTSDDGKKVRFAHGNLQYIGAGGTVDGEPDVTAPYWRFATEQWHRLGDGGSHLGNASDVHSAGGLNANTNQNACRDLFGFGTSGYDDSHQPWLVSTDHNKYTNTSLNATTDWGRNAIYNGYNEPGIWRTPTDAEWQYLLFSRSQTYRFAPSTIHSTTGLIIFPDNFVKPASVTITNPNQPQSAPLAITDAMWDTLEAHGCVFIPAAFFRNGTTVTGMGNQYATEDYTGNYWSSTIGGLDRKREGAAYYMYLLRHGNPLTYNVVNHATDVDRSYGFAVRMVMDL